MLGDDAGGHVRAYFLASDGILIDTLSEDDGKTLLAQLAAKGIGPGAIKIILQTHAHRSHIAGAAHLRSLTGARLLAHDWEADIIRGKRKAERVGFPKWSQRPHNFTVWKLQTGLALGRGGHVACDVDGTLKDGDTIGPLTVVHAPGHTKGHMAFLFGEVLFGGDIINTWPGDGPEKKPCPWDGFTLDQGYNQRSINKLADLPGVKILCPGHGDPVDGAAAVIQGLKR